MTELENKSLDKDDERDNENVDSKELETEAELSDKSEDERLIEEAKRRGRSSATRIKLELMIGGIRKYGEVGTQKQVEERLNW